MTSSTSQIEAYLDQVEPYEFEQFVADVWEEFGYRTEVTSGSQDRGIDVIAEQDNPVKQRMLIQAKAYSKENKISSNEVRNYATLYQQEDDVDEVVLVTTSRFTSQAKELAQDLDVDAIDRENLAEMVSECEFDIKTKFDQSNQNNTSTPKEPSTSVGIDAQSRTPVVKSNGSYRPYKKSQRPNSTRSGTQSGGAIGVDAQSGEPIYEQPSSDSQNFNQSNQSKKSESEGTVERVPIVLTGLLVGSLLIIDQLYDRGMLSDDSTGFIILIIIAVVILTIAVAGWLNRS